MDSILRSGFDPSAGEAVVLKMRLRAFTLGHCFLLEEIGSPLLNPFESVGMTDLLIAVIICSQPPGKARKSVLGSGSLAVAYLLCLVNRKSSLPDEIAKFRQYLQSSQAVPSMRSPSGGRPRHAPESW